jgi:hypothetical protein
MKKSFQQSSYEMVTIFAVSMTLVGMQVGTKKKNTV